MPKLRLVPAIKRAAKQCGTADAAFEAFVRLVDMDKVRGHAHAPAAAYTELVRACRLDPVAERRSERVLSVLQRARRFDATFLAAAFDVAVYSADVRLASAIHVTALSERCVTWPDKEEVDDTYLRVLRTSALPGGVVGKAEAPARAGARNGTPALHYYNGLVHVALCTREHATAATALRELHATGAGADGTTVGLVAAFHAELNDASGATALINALKPEEVTPMAYAALIRAAGKRKDWRAAREWWLRAGDAPLSHILTDADLDVTARAMAVAHDDVALAALLAARATKNMDGLLSVVDHIRQRSTPSLWVLRTAMETAWMNGCTSTASEMSNLIEQHLSRKMES